MERLWTDFVNSYWRDWRGSGHSEDRLEKSEWQQRWLERWELNAPVPASVSEVDIMRSFREQLQQMAHRLADGGLLNAKDLEWLNTTLAKGPVYRKLDSDQSQEEQPKVQLKLIAVEHSWQQVMAEVAADFVQTIAEGEGRRIRFCDNPDCLWVFYDDTRSRTKKYCDDKMCGNLMKVRRFRERQKKQT